MNKIIMLGLVAFSGNVFANHFIEESQLDVTMRNFYFDRNFTEEATFPAAKDWAMGMILNARSGYSAGVIQFGGDILATTGFKLYSDKKYAGTGLLPRDPISNEPANSYAEIGFTGKAKYGKTELKVGTLRPNNPVLSASIARLLPQTYRGISLQSNELDHLEFQAAYLDKVNHRDSTNYEAIKINTVNQRFKAAESAGLYFAGGYYRFNQQTQISAFYLGVEDLYSQYQVGLNQDYKINDQFNVSTDLRVYRSRENGQARAGNVDNDLIAANFAFKHANHKFSLGMLSHHGKTGFPYLAGGETSLFLTTWPADFLNAKEQAYSVRYDGDLKDILSGLRMMTRYSYANNIDAPYLGGDHLKEREMDYELGYKVQHGIFKDLNLGLRYAVYRNNMLPTANIKPANETRVNIDYTWRF